MKIRACHPYNFKGLIEYDADKQTFSGVLAKEALEVLGLAMKSVRSFEPNSTLEIQSADLKVGEFDPNLNRYDGCIGQVQLNQSDFVAQGIRYPAEISGVNQGLIMFETSLIIGSAYNKTEIIDSLQVLKSFDGFSPLLWIVVVLTCFTFFALVVMENSLLARVKQMPTVTLGNTFRQVITHCLRFGELTDGGATRRVTILLVSIFSLVVVHYFCSMIKTDLVVIKDPQTFSSYEDITRRGAKPVFMRGMSYDRFFNSPKAENFRKKLWLSASEQFTDDALYVDLSPVIIILMSLSAFNQKAVVITETSMMPIIVNTFCSIAGRDLSRMGNLVKILKNPTALERLMQILYINERDKKRFYEFAANNNNIEIYSEPEALIHIAKDAAETEFIQGVILNSHGKVASVLQSAARRIIETGFMIEKLQGFSKLNLLEKNLILESLLGRQDRKRRHLIDRCKSTTIVQPTINLSALQVTNFLTLFQLIASLYLVLFVILGIEIQYNHLRSSIFNVQTRRVRRARPPPFSFRR